MSTVISSLRAAISRHGLLRRNDRVLAAVSGGADSVALLLALSEIASESGLAISVAHLNHGIRGKDADADERFVRMLASKMGLKYHAGKASVPEMARRLGLSIEMAARKARYDFLLDVARKTRSVIATAHTADDQAETVLLKLARGAGMRGLAGILPAAGIGGCKVIRPLLDASRREIEEFLTSRRQSWREDKSNRDTTYLRNRVRHDILPLLEKRLNPEIRAALSRTAEVLREEDCLLERLSRSALGRCANRSTALSIRKLKAEPLAVQRRVIRLWLAEAGVTAEKVDFDVVEKSLRLVCQTAGTGRRDLVDDWTVFRRYDDLVVERSQKPSEEFRRTIRIPGRTDIPEAGITVATSMKRGLVRMKNPRLGSLPAMASLRWDAGDGTLVARSWKSGDRISPYGMDGSKKLQDVFVDAKLPAAERGRIPVLEARRQIVWLPGYRVARGWEVTDSRSRSLQIKIMPMRDA